MKKSDLFFSLIMFVGFVSYFLLMRALGLYTELYLRYLNGVIHFAVVFLAMKAYRNSTDETFSFVNTFLAGVRASIPAVFAFAMFQFIYLSAIDPWFMQYVKEHAPMGDWLSPAKVAFALGCEGMVATLITSYAGMRLIAAQEHARFPRF